MKINRMVKLGVLLAILISVMGGFSGSRAAPDVVYVDVDAAGANDGTSWVSAFADLQSALAGAAPGDELWVAEGVYKPTAGPDRTATFQLVNGVVLYGGFRGDEASLSERDWVAHPTVLSGDIGNPGDPADNSRHVVTASGTDSSAVLDGFTVTEGYADGVLLDGWGGAIVNELGSPSLSNLILRDNYASEGGGMYNYQGHPSLIRVAFESNSRVGMLNVSSNPTLLSVTFSGNTGPGYGGGMHNVWSDPMLVNVVFSGNQASFGGAIENDYSNPVLVNVTFSGNSASVQGGAIWNNPGSPTLANCILWGNSAPTDSQISGGAPVVSYTIVQGGFAGTGNLDADPLFVDADGVDDITGTPDDDLRLGTGSPAINAGDNSALPADASDLDGDADTSEPIPFDLDGSPRLQHGTVDLGVYEDQAPNQVPVALDDTATKVGDNPVTIDVLANDSDPDGDPLSVASVSDPSHGWVLINGDHTLTYTPQVGYLGSDVFTYTVSDGYGGTALATVAVFNVTDLGALTGWTHGLGLNNAGQVVGHYTTACDPPPPFGLPCWVSHPGIWSAAGGMQALGEYGFGFFYDLNEAGQVAGMDWLWTADTFQNLGMPMGEFSTTMAYGLNNLDQVVGRGLTMSAENHAFLWTPGGGAQDLGTLGGLESEAWGINNLGQVVGASSTAAGEQHAFLWTDANGMQDLGTLGGSESHATAINDTGQVVGWASLPSGDSHAFLWTAVDGMMDLGTLGGSESGAMDINELGQVVGAAGAPTGEGHAFLWTPMKGMQDLGTLGGSQSEALAINNVGQIVGRSDTASGGESAARWTFTNQAPVPQDDSATMLKDTAVVIDALANDSDLDNDPLIVESVSVPRFGTVEIHADHTLTYTPQPDFYGSDRFTYTVSDNRGGTGSASVTLVPAIRNDTWTRAYPLQLASSEAIEQLLERPYQSRWYKFDVLPGSEILVTLTGLPANYNLTLYSDIAAAFRELNSTEDLVQLSAEFAPDMFSPDMFSPDMFSPDMFSPDMFSPDMFSPDMFSPDMFSPDMFSPDMFSPDMFSPDMFSPDMFSPDMFSPDMFSPDMFSPDMFSPDMFSPDMFSPDPATFASAQLRSMLAVSAGEGTVAEGVRANSWNKHGEFYIRVSGNHGVFGPENLFHLEVTVYSGACENVSPTLPESNTTAVNGDYKTIVITDMARMAGTPEEKLTLEDSLEAFAERGEVAGVRVDMGLDARVAAANALADAYPDCPYAKNLAAGAIKGIIDNYRAAGNPLEYIVIIGNDDVIPFFRYPDNALLANEMNYSPPVRENTTSQASLKLGYVLGQDEYGSRIQLVQKGSILPLPDLAVGRLVETPADVMHMLDTYAATLGGVLETPSTALVTGYDFLADAAAAIEGELRAGLGEQNLDAVESLITDRAIAPQLVCPAGSVFDGQCSWTANLMLDALLGRRHDIVFLAGHFTASSWLASDNRSRLLTSDLESSGVDLENALVFSAGCHVGYNIVNEHNVPGVTREPDWAQAFARQGATFIGGTGYQYGDTDFVEYSERLYLEFTRQLRMGAGPVSIGDALVDAKQAYLGSTAQMGGIHEKSLLQTTLFGLPMLSIDLPFGRINPAADPSIVSAANPFQTNPGSLLGLRSADILIEPELTEVAVPLNNSPTDQAVYLSGRDGVVSNPSQPVLPLELYNISLVDNVLRGVGFRGGAFMDSLDVLPLTGSAATEIRGVHTPFFTDYFFPVRPWNVNYFGALVGAQDGATRLSVLPAQYRSSNYGSIRGTLRQYDSMIFRLYYSSNTASYSEYGYVPAQAAPPLISGISASHDPQASEIEFQVTVVGDPTAGIQEVWVVYTIEGDMENGEWLPVDLVRDAADSRLWTGALSLPGGVSPSDVRYMVQAVNGVGLVSYATNLGVYYTPGLDPGAPPPQTQEPTELSLEPPPAIGAYGTSVTLGATLTSEGVPLADKIVVFGLGSQKRLAVTDADGRAEATFLLLGYTGNTKISVSLGGSEEFAPSSMTSSVIITKQATQLAITPEDSEILVGEPGVFILTLTDAEGRRLPQKTVLLDVWEIGSGELVYAEAIATDFTGQAVLNFPVLPVGQYTLSALFGGGGMLDPRYLASSAAGGLDVMYRFAGFFPPVDNLPILNKVKAGQAIPVKFSLDGDHGLGILSGVPSSVGIYCDTSLPMTDLTETVAASNSGLSYDPDEDQYIYVWKTVKSWAGSCRRFILRLDDGSEHYAIFKFK